MRIRITSVAMIAFALMLLGCDTGGRVDPVYQNNFIKYYGEDGNQEGADLYVNDDGTMVLLGNSSSLTDLSMPFIVKTDSMGNVLWQRAMGEPDEVAVDVELITQGANQGKLVVISNVKTGDNTRIRVTILDQNGKGVDSVIVRSPVWQAARSVTVATNGNFMISGSIAPDPVKNPGISGDNADIIVLRVDQALQTDPLPWVWQGGQSSGSGVNTFEVTLGGVLKYAVFGWSDYPLDESPSIYEDKFEVIAFNDVGISSGVHPRSHLVGERQEASQAIQVPASQEAGFFMIGTTRGNGNSDIYINKYSKDLSAQKLDQKLALGRRMEGIGVASAIQEEGYFLLANEIQDNNNHNIVLLHIRRDGSQVWSSTFGTEEGDDSAGAVAALKSGRVAVLGTIDLETQKKMALIIVGKGGGFSN